VVTTELLLWIYNFFRAYKIYFWTGCFLKGDYSTAIQYLSQSVRLDSSLIHSSFLLAFANLFSGDMNKAKYIVSMIHAKRDQISHVLWKTFTDYQYALLFETPTDQLKYIRQSLQLDDQLPFSNFDLGKAYLDLCQYDGAIPAFEKALGIYKKWKTKPAWVWNYTALGLAYHEAGQ
jgi:tetratricopeptide (TPR) repeat protein